MGGVTAKVLEAVASGLGQLRRVMPTTARVTAHQVGRPTGRRKRAAWAKGAKTTASAVRKLETEGSVQRRPVTWRSMPAAKKAPTIAPPTISARRKRRWRGRVMAA